MQFECKGLKTTCAFGAWGDKEIDGVAHESHPVRDSSLRQDGFELHHIMVIEKDLWKDR